MKDALSLERGVEAALTLGLAAASGLLLAGLLTGGSERFLRAGLLVLLFTPVVRVVLVTVGLLARRDFLFGAISAFVLAVLASSVLVAFRS
jgi:uncharacterized membrane protein